ncbi:hypothetical protein ANN_20992 [Periplaneta americana]|uniref:Uncharacterized protein n=1 Tax=Periplaneta americana TaxID=6978 RepID=A0ABQ8SE53_PERAM|nr:hypothetical protein ANN_20992 [Periplaneta americana]
MKYEMAVIDSKKQERDEFDELMVHIGVNGKFQLRFNLLFNMLFVLIFSICCFNVYIALTVPGHWCHVPGRNETNYTIEEWKEMNIPKLKWVGHVMRMDASEPCKRIILTNPGDKRRRGRPHLRWIDGVEEDLVRMGYRNWRTVAQDRDRWQRLLREARAHNGLDESGYGFRKCQMYNTTVTYNRTIFEELEEHRSIIDCQHGWEYDTTWYKMTVPTQEDWVCDKELYVANSLFAARAGEALGSLVFGHLGDTMGRRPVLFIAVATMVVGRRGTVVFREEIAHSNAPVLRLDWWYLHTHRPGMDYWRRVESYAAKCLNVQHMSNTFRMFPESPRWLASSGKTAECEKVLSNIAHVNGNTLPENTFTILKKADQAKEGHFGVGSLFSSWRLARNTFLELEQLEPLEKITFPISILNRTPHRETFRACMHSNQTCFVRDRAYLLGFRTKPIRAGSLQWLVTSLVVGVKFLITITVYVGYLLNTEIYPICVRQSGSSVGFTGSGTLGVVAPYIAYLGSAVGVNYPYFILAGLALLGAVCSLLLPETLNEKLPETLADAAQFGLNQKFWSLPSRQRGQMKATELKTEEL